MRFFLIFTFLLFSTESFAVTRYVTPAGAGLQNGSSWNNAFPGTSLQAAINASVPGDEVWVMSGTYFTTSIASRNIYFSLANGVSVYGSFSGTEASILQRSFSCGFTSVLSAEIGLPGNADNSYHVLSNSGLNTTAILDGFTITGANANFDLVGNDNRSLGGGMLNNAANGGTCTPTIRNCAFTGNAAVFGAGMFNHGQNGGNASPVISNCIFYQNNATQGGGGMDNFGYNGNASPVITNTIFYANSAVSRAGAMYCWGGGNGNASPVILHTVFVNNSAVDGGGIVSDRTNIGVGNSGAANPVIRNSIFHGNTAGVAGPQFYILGAASFTLSYSVIDMAGQNPPHTITGPGTGNITAAPLFFDLADADGADNCWLTTDDGLQLLLNSPGIDAGDNAGLPVTDIRNYPRIMNGVADIGAYEFVAAALPVTWLGFSGRTMERRNELNWVAVTGTEHRGFEVQRSDDGLSFYKIGENTEVLPAGAVHQYLYTDGSINRSRYYYRIKQADHNGQYSLSSIVVLNNKSAAETMQVFPNPANEKVTISLPDGLQPGELILVSSGGRELQRIRAVSTVITLPVSALQPGLYFIYCTQLREGVRFIKH